MAWVIVGVLASAGVFHLLVRLGPAGRAVCDWAAKAPALDVVVCWFLHGPHAAAVVWWWMTPERSAHMLAAALGATVVAQMLALTLWGWAHELTHPAARRGPRIVFTLNRRVGRFRQVVAVWSTGVVVPLFTLIRVAEIVVYPVLVWLVRFPRYDQSQWVMVSRQKFSGLVGWDLIWCLYCDWMTGVWSLGSEMLRNVESFWCPIRFGSPEKCANCAHDFPDLNGGWVRADGTMAEVTAAIEKHYPGPGGENGWFGHPGRQVTLTIDGKPNEGA